MDSKYERWTWTMNMNAKHVMKTWTHNIVQNMNLEHERRTWTPNM